MSDSRSAVASVAELAARAAADTPDLIAAVATAIKCAIAADADPYLLAGVLIEGIVQTLTQGVPEPSRPQIETACVRFMRARLSTDGQPGAG